MSEATPSYDQLRRIDLTRLTPAELAIREAQIAVESAGASAVLTRASVLLQEARSKVADHVDGVALDEEPDAEGWEWAIVEVFGHRRHAGRTREEERFGAKMLRIDIPVDGDPAKGWITHFYGGSSIFSFGLADRASVMRANKPYESASRYALQSPDDD